MIRPDVYGKQPFDAPNRLLFWGDFAVPHGLVLTPVVDWHTGFPFSLLNEQQDFVGPRNEGGRFPQLLTLDHQSLNPHAMCRTISPADSLGRSSTVRSAVCD